MSFGAGPNSKPVPTIWTRGWPSMRMADSGVGEPGPGGKTDDRRLFANAEIMTLIKALGLATGPLPPPPPGPGPPTGRQQSGAPPPSSVLRVFVGVNVCIFPSYRSALSLGTYPHNDGFMKIQANVVKSHHPTPHTIRTHRTVATNATSDIWSPSLRLTSRTPPLRAGWSPVPAGVKGEPFDATDLRYHRTPGPSSS